LRQRDLHAADLSASDAGRLTVLRTVAGDAGLSAVVGSRQFAQLGPVEHLDLGNSAPLRNMNELLVHLAGSQQTPGELALGVGSPPIRYV